MATSNCIRSTIRVLTVSRLLGARIYVSTFPALPGIPDRFCMPAGIYLVESIVMHLAGNVEIGLADPETKEHLDYFQLDELQWTKRHV